MQNLYRAHGAENISVAFSTEKKTDSLALLHLGQQRSNYERTSCVGQTDFKKEHI